MPPPLIVGGRTKPARRHRFQRDPFEVTVEGKIEIETGLFAICYNIKSCGDLIVNCRDHRVFNHFLNISRSEFV
jgi:hypothetical protein